MIYTRPIKKPKNMLEGLRNFLQMIINNIESGDTQEALYQAVDLQNDLYPHGAYSHPVNGLYLISDDHSLDEIINRYALNDICSYSHPEMSVKEILSHIENLRRFDDDINLTYELHKTINGEEITHDNFRAHFEARCQHYKKFLHQTNISLHKHKLEKPIQAAVSHEQ